MKGKLFSIYGSIYAILAVVLLVNCAGLTDSNRIGVNSITLKTITTHQNGKNLFLEMEFTQNPTSYLSKSSIVFSFGNHPDKKRYVGIPFESSQFNRSQCPSCILLTCKDDKAYIGTSYSEYALVPTIKEKTYSVQIPWKKNFGDRIQLYVNCSELHLREFYKQGEVLKFMCPTNTTL